MKTMGHSVARTRHKLIQSAIARAIASGTLVLCAAGLTVVFPSMAQAAATLFVDNGGTCSNTTGTPFCTIPAAVAQAVAGDTVDVAAGTYTGRVLVTRSGTFGAPITIVTRAGAIVKSAGRGFDLSSVAWITIKGFTVANTGSDGIRCVLCANVNLTNNKIKGAMGKGITISSSSDMILSGNATEDSKYIGIAVNGSTRLVISGGYVTRTGLRISGKSYKGIKFDSTTDSTIEGVETFDNSDTGIYLINGTTGVRIKKVVTHHNAREFNRAAAGIEIRSSGNIVDSSIAYANEDSGINMRWGGSDALIVNNIAYRNNDHGIDALESPNPGIFHNSVYKNVTAGINVEGNSTNATIMNNISHDNGINSPRTEGDIRVTTSSVPGAVSNYNVVFSSAGGRIYHWKGIYYRTLKALRSINPGVEVKGIQADPKWADKAGGDFQLTFGSPAIDSGNSDALPPSEGDHDALGNSRCDDPFTLNTGSPQPGIDFYDRGAFEYLTSCSG